MVAKKEIRTFIRKDGIMLEVDGTYIIKKISERLKFENILCYDSNIINKLRSLTKFEIQQLCNLGDICKWHNDKINS
jgi:hypothetical protein